MKRFLGKAVTTMVVLASMCSVAYAGEAMPSNDSSEAYVLEFYISEDGQMELLDSGTPRYTLIKQMVSGFSIDTNRTAHIYAECEAYEAAEVSIKATLQKDNNGTWKNVKTFSDSVSGEKLASLSREYAVLKGLYRLEITGTVDNGTTSESSTKYSTEKTCYSELSEND